MKQENVIQTALSMALQAYCHGGTRPELRQFPPYAVQQGAALQKFCGDLIGILDQSEIILLEIKELDHDELLLREFKDEQHKECLRFEELGLPLAYAYNAKKILAYNLYPKPVDWPSRTLSAINRSKPSDLPNSSPSLGQHQTMLDWMEAASASSGGDQTNIFGRIHGVIDAPHELKNGLLTLLFGVEEKVLTALTEKEMKKVVNTLKNNSSLTPLQQLKLQDILGASAAAFADFSNPPTKRKRNKVI